jgi:hypothetical protein
MRQKQKKKDIKPLIFGVFGAVAVIFLFPAIVLSILSVSIVLFIVLYFIFPKFKLSVNNKVKNFMNKFKKVQK